MKGNVEGYSEMSDEAFARRFYSDRAELRDLGVPLQSQRDEFTGEELYTLRSENYFLPELELTDDELAALQTCFYLLEGKFAYAEPLRLALQNLALGRPALADEAPSATAVRVEMRDPDYSAEMPGRLAKLETAISKQRTVKFGYRAMTSGKETERTLNPYGLLHDRGVWYVIGQDLDREAIRTFRVSRIRGDIRFATRRERDFRLPAEFDIEELPRPRRRGSSGSSWARRESRSGPRPAGGSSARSAGQLEDGVFVTEYASLPMLASWVLRQDGRATPVAPDELRREVAESLRRVRAAHEGEPSKPAREVAVREAEATGERSSGPVTPERFGLLQALLAYLLAACGEEKEAVIPAAEVVERFQIPPDELEDDLNLLNLVNFGGGCYAVYAELHGDEVHVDKELWGDQFRAAPRLTPLEARAIRLALEFVGPLIAAEAHRPLDRVRKKLEDTFGAFDLAQSPEPSSDKAEERLVATLTDAIRRRRLVEIEYLKEEEGTPTTHLVEPYSIERRLPHWYVHTWDRTRDDERSFRLDRMRSATLSDETFEPREGFEPGPAERHAGRPRALLARGRALGGRARRPRPLRRLGGQRAEGRQPGMARRRDPALPRRGRAARAARAPPRDREARAVARQGARASTRLRARLALSPR